MSYGYNVNANINNRLNKYDFSWSLNKYLQIIIKYYVYLTTLENIPSVSPNLVPSDFEVHTVTLYIYVCLGFSLYLWSPVKEIMMCIADSNYNNFV